MCKYNVFSPTGVKICGKKLPRREKEIAPPQKKECKKRAKQLPPTTYFLVAGEVSTRAVLRLFFGCSSSVLRSPWLAPAANCLWLNSINQSSSCSPAAPRNLVDFVNHSAFGGYAMRKIYEIYRFPPAGPGVCYFIITTEHMAQLQGLNRFVRSGEIITLSPFFIIGKPNCFRLQRYELFATWKPFFEKKTHRRTPQGTFSLVHSCLSCLQIQKRRRT